MRSRPRRAEGLLDVCYRNFDADVKGDVITINRNGVDTVHKIRNWTVLTSLYESSLRPYMKSMAVDESPDGHFWYVEIASAIYVSIVLRTGSCPQSIERTSRYRREFMRIQQDCTLQILDDGLRHRRSRLNRCYRLSVSMNCFSARQLAANAPSIRSTASLAGMPTGRKLADHVNSA